MTETIQSTCKLATPHFEQSLTVAAKTLSTRAHGNDRVSDSCDAANLNTHAKLAFASTSSPQHQMSNGAADSIKMQLIVEA